MENPYLTVPQFKNPEEEINFLRQKVAEKEKALSEKNFSVEKSALAGGEISRYRDMPAEQVLHESYAMPSAETEAEPGRYPMLVSAVCEV